MKSPETVTPAGMSAEEKALFIRRRRGRNLAMMLVLVALVVLFYFITLAKIAGGAG